MSWGETLFLKKVIEGQKKLVGSESTTIVANFTNKTFTPKIDGVITLRISGQSAGGSSGASYAHTVKFIGSDGTEQLATIYSESYPTTSFVNFSVKAKTSYTVSISSNSNVGLKINSLDICATVVDYNYFSIGGDE